MTDRALTLAVAPGSVRTAAGAVIVEQQAIARQDPTDEIRDRWVIVDTFRWADGQSHEAVFDAVVDLARATGARVVIDITDEGQVFYEMAKEARDRGLIDRMPRSVILSSGQVAVEGTLPRVSLVSRFEAKLKAGRIVVGPSEHSKELERQIGRLRKAKLRPKAEEVEENPEELVLAAMLGTFWRTDRPALPRYLARDGHVYPSRRLSPDIAY